MKKVKSVGVCYYEYDEKMDVEEFIKAVNKCRREEKDTWFTWIGEVNQDSICLKVYNTWVQRALINGVRAEGSPMELKVKAFNSYLRGLVTK